MMILAALLFSQNPSVFAQEAPAGPSAEHFMVDTHVLDNGKVINEIIINGPPEPPLGITRKVVVRPTSEAEAGIVTLAVPAYSWSFGCSTTSAAMIAAYYDRNGYPDMYSGPTNGGVMPMTNNAWPDWVDAYGDSWHQCPLSATHDGLDGRTTKGHVDDYWWGYGNNDPDPFIRNWTEHSYGECTGDFMRTNQYNYDNFDGSTSFWNYTNGAPTHCSDLLSFNIERDGGCGIEDFYESRGYTVEETYNQYADSRGLLYGFTYEQYKAEIDAGRPVMIHVEGHTMVGVGYDDSKSNLMYINDTWDHDTHTMEWGGSYSGMDHVGVTVVRLAPVQGKTKTVPLPAILMLLGQLR